MKLPEPHRGGVSVERRKLLAPMIAALGRDAATVHGNQQGFEIFSLNIEQN